MVFFQEYLRTRQHQKGTRTTAVAGARGAFSTPTEFSLAKVYAPKYSEHPFSSKRMSGWHEQCDLLSHLSFQVAATSLIHLLRPGINCFLACIAKSPELRLFLTPCISSASSSPCCFRWPWKNSVLLFMLNHVRHFVVRVMFLACQSSAPRLGRRIGRSQLWIVSEILAKIRYERLLLLLLRKT